MILFEVGPALILKMNLIAGLPIKIKKIKNKILTKSHGDEVTDFYDIEIPKVDSNHDCLAVISFDLLSIKMETIIQKYIKLLDILFTT